MGSRSLHADDNLKFQLRAIDNLVGGASRGDVFVFYCMVLLYLTPPR